MISGYLFYRTYQVRNVKRKLISRIHTLFIPYILWNMFYAISMIVLVRIHLIHNISISNNILKILLQMINSEFSPLWFVKYLMIFTITAPFFYYILKNKYLGIIFLLGCMGLNCYFYYSGIMTLPINVNENSLIMLNYQYIFYGIGSYAALNLRNIVEEKSEKRTKICLVMLFLLIIINIIMVKQQMENVIINHTWRLCYICVLWFVFDHLPQISIKSWMNDSFFLCCSHLIILQCSQRVCEIILSKMNLSGGIFSVLEFLILPIIIIILLLLLAEVLKKYLPRTWNVISGRRG